MSAYTPPKYSWRGTENYPHLPFRLLEDGRELGTFGLPNIWADRVVAKLNQHAALVGALEDAAPFFKVRVDKLESNVAILVGVPGMPAQHITDAKVKLSEAVEKLAGITALLSASKQGGGPW